MPEGGFRLLPAGVSRLVQLPLVITATGHGESLAARFRILVAEDNPSVRGAIPHGGCTVRGSRLLSGGHAIDPDAAHTRGRAMARWNTVNFPPELR